MFKKFKEFAFKGNVVDMAVGVVIGGAFGKIVSSFVADIITPLISLLTGKANLVDLFAVLKTPEGVTEEAAKLMTLEEAKAAGVGTLNYGMFIQTIIDFFLVALSIFIFVSLIQKAREKNEARKKAKEEPKEEAPAEDPKPTTEELLAEIRDLLKDGKENKNDKE